MEAIFDCNWRRQAFSVAIITQLYSFGEDFFVQIKNSAPRRRFSTPGVPVGLCTQRACSVNAHLGTPTSTCKKKTAEPHKKAIITVFGWSILWTYATNFAQTYLSRSLEVRP